MPFAVYILGFLIFSQTTSEFMVAGIMPSLSEEFGVSTAAIGYLISVYAVGMIIGGPLLIIGLLKVPRKRALLIVTSIFLIGQSLASIATSYKVMLVARAITGVSSAACFGISMAITFYLVGAQARGRAASVVLGGLMIATAAGLPIVMMSNQYFGWRASFWGIVIIVFVAGLLALWFIPATIKQPQGRIREEFALFKNYPLWAAYTTSMFIIGATFAAFSYFTLILTNLTGIHLNIVPFILAIYGGSTIIGNIIVGRLTDSYMFPTLTVGLSILTIALVIFGLFVKLAIITIPVIMMIGLAGVSLNPAMATRVTRVGGTGTLVSTVHTSIINLGIVLGSSVGGLVIEAGYGLTSPLWVGALLAMIGLISLLPVFRGKCHAINI